MKNKMINKFLCEFLDKSLEESYLDYELNITRRHLNIIVRALAVFYLIFAIPDYFVIEEKYIFRMMLTIRIFYFILLIISACMIKKVKSGKIANALITSFEAISSILVIFNFIVYPNPDFLIQSYGIMLFIIIIFLIPNRLLNITLLTLFTIVIFTVASLKKFNDIEANKILVSVFYNTITIIICFIYNYRCGYTKRKQYLATKELEFLTYNDPLTGLGNRLKLNEDLSRQLKSAKETGSFFSLIIFDIDDFKPINDTYGHIVGDKTIIELGYILKKVENDSIVIRWGGEEFVVILPNKTADQAAVFAEKLRVKINKHTFNNNIRLSCSFGVTQSKPNDSMESIIVRADDLLYTAKNMGKNIVVSK